jgi:hypothetical protein
MNEESLHACFFFCLPPIVAGVVLYMHVAATLERISRPEIALDGWFFIIGAFVVPNFDQTFAQEIRTVRCSNNIILTCIIMIVARGPVFSLARAWTRSWLALLPATIALLSTTIIVCRSWKDLFGHWIGSIFDTPTTKQNDPYDHGTKQHYWPRRRPQRCGHR